MKYSIEKLNLLDMALILFLFEGSTLLVMGVLEVYNIFSGFWEPVKIVLTGTTVGVIGTLAALAVWNNSEWSMRGVSSQGKIILTKISIIKASILNAVFLIVLFSIEWLLAGVRGIPAAGTAILGFTAVFLTLAVLFAVYNSLNFKLGIMLGGKEARIERISVLRAAVIAGIYEAIILPLMALFFTIPLPTILSFLFTGAAAGFIGGLAGTLIFNIVSPYAKVWIEIR